jgi:hypothetical protein
VLLTFLSIFNAQINFTLNKCFKKNYNFVFYVLIRELCIMISKENSYIYIKLNVTISFIICYCIDKFSSINIKPNDFRSIIDHRAHLAASVV